MRFQIIGATPQCISGVPWVVPCGARGGGGVAVAPGGHCPVVNHWHWGGRRVSHSVHTLRHSPQSEAGLRAPDPGVVGAGRRGPHKVDSRGGGDLLGRDKGVYLVPRLRRREGGAGHGRRPIVVGWVPAKTRSGSPRVATTTRSREVPGRCCQRTCPLWWAPLALERGGDKCGWFPL